jgi:hypothetical protein
VAWEHEGAKRARFRLRWQNASGQTTSRATLRKEGVVTPHGVGVASEHGFIRTLPEVFRERIHTTHGQGRRSARACAGGRGGEGHTSITGKAQLV